MTSPASIRTGMSAEEFGAAFRENRRCALGRSERSASRHDLYSALALTVRDRLLDRVVESIETYGGSGARRVAYLSAEYLPGPHLGNNLLNLGITEAAREALGKLGFNLEELMAE